MHYDYAQFYCIAKVTKNVHGSLKVLWKSERKRKMAIKIPEINKARDVSVTTTT